MPFIPLETFTNQAQTTVSAGGTTAPSGGTVETWTVASSASFPPAEYGAQEFHVADPAAPSEIITVLGVTGTTWTVMRGTEATTPVTHAAGFTVQQVVTAGTLAGLQYPPWQFPAQKYGAQGDGRIGTGGTGTAGSSAFSDAGASFVNAAAPAGDVGKVIIVNQGTGSATVPRNPFCGTITAVNSPTSVTLSGTLTYNATAAPYIYGTDDAQPIRDAVTAAATWAASTGNYKAQVVFEPCNYMLGSVYQQAAPVTYNTHIPVPYASDYDRRLTIDLLGTGDAAEPMYWGGAVPSAQGTCLVSAVWTAAQPDGTYGQMSVIGTPTTSAGLGNGGITGSNFANVLVHIDGITAVTPYNSEQYGFDLRYAAQASIPVAAAVAFAPVNYAAQPCGGPWLRASSVPANGVSAGLAMPRRLNNDNSDIGVFAAEGFSRGIILAEHINIHRLSTIYCDIGIAPETSGQGHTGTIAYWSCEGCNYGIATDGGGGMFPLVILNADFEGIVTSYLTDTGGGLQGVMYWYDITPYSPAGGAGINAPYMKVINQRMYPGPWVANGGLSIPAPPAAPSSGVAQQNTAYRDATVYCSAATSITAVSAGPASGSLTALGLAGGAGAVVPVRVPSGHWYSVTYTGLLTTKWYLD